MEELNKIVKEIFGDYTGYAVEAGAFDGVFESTTLDLENLGWEVLLIEPIPDAFEKLLDNRNNDYCLQYALGASNVDDVPFEVYLNWWGASISSLKPDERILKEFAPDKKETILVKQKTLDFCLESIKFPKLDILSLDVEGGELEALKGFDIDKWKPTMLIIENIYMDAELRNCFKDYTLIDRIVYNDIWVRNV